jgi:hypothetical protein
MAFSAGLDGMVLARRVVGNDSIVQNFQSVVERLKYCADPQAHPVSQAVRSFLMPSECDLRSKTDPV